MNHDLYLDKVRGCWLGKNIGGTLGTPLEGQKSPNPLPFAFPQVNEPNDDLDLQLVWLDLLRRNGVELTAADFEKAWLEHIVYPFDEYGVACANIRRGLAAPLTGTFNNYFLECMGAPIRSEIWGCLAPGKPEIAGGYARLDASVDHGGEGVYGEIFFACMEALAFEESDLCRVIDGALEFLPESSEVKQAVRETRDSWQKQIPLETLRTRLVERYDRGNFTHAVLNLAFTVAGMLYGEMDFLRSMVTAINLGYDTDCTGATAGAVIGIIHGEKALREKYKVDFDKRILAGWGVRGIEVPPTIEAMSEEIAGLAARVAALAEPPRIEKGFELPKPDDSRLDLDREFLIGAYPDLESAKSALSGWSMIHSRVDHIVLNRFVRPGCRLYLKCMVELPESFHGQVRVFGHSNCPTRTFAGGEPVAEFKERGDFAPSPHRYWGAVKPAPLSGNATPVLVELQPLEGGKTIDFQLIVADEATRFPSPEARITVRH